MGMMKNYLMFLEEKGYVEWNDFTNEYDHLVPDIYAKHIMDEYKQENNTK
tara:strand:+ start:114 stop:263 length:150 start_codon:yes stop_codon:yes gene_type:complete